MIIYDHPRGRTVGTIRIGISFLYRPHIITSPAMTRSELISRLASRFRQLTAVDAELAVKTIIDALSDRLALGGRAEIRGFGSFSVNIRPPRRGRNPKTGDQVMVPEKRVPHFKAGMELRKRINLDV